MAELSKLELRDAVYKLFSKGNLPHSDKVKALIPKAGARNLYHHTWKQSGKPDHYEKGAGVEAKEGVVTGFAGVLSEPGREAEGSETKQEQGEEVEQAPKEEEQQKEGAKEEGVKEEAEKETITPAFGEAESETFPGLKVADETLPFKVNLSIKTIALYEILAGEASDGLSLGKFLDRVTEDYVLGRGVDLGLVELRKQSGGQQNG